MDAASSTLSGSNSNPSQFREDFGHHVSAMEYGAQLTGELGGGLGFGKTAGAGAGISAEAESVFRVEYQNGEQSSFALRYHLKPEASIEGGAVALTPNLDMVGVRDHVGGNLQTTMELKLKANEETGELVQDGQITLNFAGEFNAQTRYGGGNLQAQVEVVLDTERSRDFLNELAQSKNAEAAALDYVRAAVEVPNASVEISTYQSDAIKLSPELSAGGVGVTPEMEWERKNVGKIYREELSPGDILDMFDR